MKHSVNFTNVFNKWDNAIPIGNGVYGAMLYYENGILNLPLNHYEVYYNVSDKVLPSEKEKDFDSRINAEIEKDGGKIFGKERIERRIMADRNVPAEGEMFCEYRRSREVSSVPPKNGTAFFSTSHPATGDLSFGFDSSLSAPKSDLSLLVEDAKTVFSLKGADRHIEMEAFMAREDLLVADFRETGGRCLDRIGISLKPYRDLDAPDVSFFAVDESTFAYTVKRAFNKDSKPFVFSGVLKLVGAEGSLTFTDYEACINITERSESYTVLVGVYTDFRYTDTLISGVEAVNSAQTRLDLIRDEHRKYWKAFFDRSSINIPDKFLEHVYYINQYALDCCSGKDGIMKHHACGLNGLWDIKHPNLWGSIWYWDVNIQASFAGVFSSNRTDLGKVFSDGLRSYIGLAERYAKYYHNIDGVSADYPHFAYYCMWPWCCQYLWYQYEYTGDVEYLRKEAYPLFLKVAKFCTEIFEYDEKRDVYSIYPDICPEQGPLSHDTTITVSSVKYLFEFTLKAAQILGDSSEILDTVRIVYEKMPEYAVSGDGFWGRHLKDSVDAPDNMWIRHPSLLMPIYPIGELDPLTGGERIRELVSNTVDYLEDHTEYGVFPGSWIAAAAARCGRGDTALRILYEQGIDHMLRSNGLTAEQTERFINYCLVSRQPLYYPCMMEFTGEMLAAVNEMLIASYGGIIRVFPALPGTENKYAHAIRHGRSLMEYPVRYNEYEPWKNVSFEKLLTKGAFEVSAALKDGRLSFIALQSKIGGAVRIACPYFENEMAVSSAGESVEFTFVDGILSFDTVAGKNYVIRGKGVLENEESKACDLNESTYYGRDVIKRRTYTGRTIFIGEDTESEYRKALDSATTDWFIGNSRQHNRGVYKFDFGCNEQKDYYSMIPAAPYVGPERVSFGCRFEMINEGALIFTPKRGYGFSSEEGIKRVKRDGPDPLRADLLEGDRPVEFLIELPRGRYELLVVSGDELEESVTCLEGMNGFKAGGRLLAPGRWQAEVIPVSVGSEEMLRLKVSGGCGKKWKLAYIIVNATKSYC